MVKQYSYLHITKQIITVRLQIDIGHLTVMGVYTPEERKRDKTQIFYEDLQKQINKSY